MRMTRVCLGRTPTLRKPDRLWLNSTITARPLKSDACAYHVCSTCGRRLSKPLAEKKVCSKGLLGRMGRQRRSSRLLFDDTPSFVAAMAPTGVPPQDQPRLWRMLRAAVVLERDRLPGQIHETRPRHHCIRWDARPSQSSRTSAKERHSGPPQSANWESGSLTHRGCCVCRRRRARGRGSED